MDPQRWRQIEGVLIAALDHTGEERAAFIREVCGEDFAMRREVEELLAADEGAAAFLEAPPSLPSQLMPEPPPPVFAGYRLEMFLGAGGRGSVYKAWDDRLERFVALKFLHEQLPTRMQQLIDEAKAQARIEHPHVCKVYEAGEAEGRAFISMQFINGAPLSDAHQDMREEEKIKIIRQIAEALHATHECGFIHRDVKPANIMVQKLETGWYPYVMDFGLARNLEWPYEGTTGLSGTILIEGTPGFMAPELFLGDLERTDRRVDVYALGASLYFMWSGHPPLAKGTNEKEGVGQTPLSLRSCCPDVSPDFNAIVMKCLAFEADGRYSTARELAEDLERYLSSDPIRARPATVTYVLGRKLRKHKYASTAVFLAVVGMLVLVVIAVRERIRAAERAELAQSFAFEAASIQHFVRHAHMAPLHDVRPTYSTVRARMDLLEARLATLGEAASGPGHCTLGAGYVAIDEHGRGVEHLQKMWDDGYRSTICEYALGNAQYRLYGYRLWTEVMPIKDERARKEAETRLKQTLLAPALVHMQQGASGENVAESRSYALAQIAYAEGRLDDAILEARRAFSEKPWIYEAKSLEGQASFEKLSTIPSDEAAEQNRILEQIAAAFTAATQVGRSDAALLVRQASILRYAVRITPVRGPQKGELIQTLLDANEQAVRVNPESPWALMSLAWALYYQGREELHRGGNGRARLERAVALAEQSISMGSTYGQAEGLLGDIHMAFGWDDDRRGVDPRAAMDRAHARFREAAEAQPDSGWLWNDLGVLYCSRAAAEARFGDDADPWFERGIEAITRSALSEHRYDHAVSNLAWAHAERAMHLIATGRDPQSSVERALAYAAREAQAHPLNFQASNNAALAYLAQAEFDLAEGRDPHASIDGVERMARKTLERHDKELEARRYLALAALFRARHAQRLRPDDIDEHLTQAFEVLDHVAQESARDMLVLFVRVRLALFGAAQPLLTKQRRAALLVEADSVLSKAEESSPQSVDVALGRAEYHLQKWNFLTNAAPQERRAVWVAGQQWAQRATQQAPSMPRGWALVGAWAWIEAQETKDETGANEARARSHAALQKALKRNRFLAQEISQWLQQDAQKIIESSRPKDP